MAQDLHQLVQRFSDEDDVRVWESYQLLKQLLDEQCVVVEPAEGEGVGEGEGEAARPPYHRSI